MDNATRTEKENEMNHDEIKAGDFLVIAFGKGTQGIKVIGTTAKRLEIIRCQQYLSECPFWTGTISKISRTDSRIQSAWAVPASIAAKAPSDEEIAEWKEIAAAQAACSKLVNKAIKPFENQREELFDLYHVEGERGFLVIRQGRTEDNYNAEKRALTAAQFAAERAAVAEWSAKSGRDRYGRLLA